MRTMNSETLQVREFFLSSQLCQYQEPGNEYRRWVYEFANKFCPDVNQFEIIAASNRDYLETIGVTVRFLSERWDINWLAIKHLIESGELEYKIVPHAVKVQKDENSIGTCASLLIPWTQIQKIEDSYPLLSKIAREHFRRRRDKQKNEQRERAFKTASVMRRLRTMAYSKGMDFDDFINSLPGLIAKDSVSAQSAARWKASMEAGCLAVSHAIVSGRKWYKSTTTQEEDFLSLMRRKYAGEEKIGPHAEAEDIAWKALPQEYKAGAGNPAKKSNPPNS